MDSPIILKPDAKASALCLVLTKTKVDSCLFTISRMHLRCAANSISHPTICDISMSSAAICGRTTSNSRSLDMMTCKTTTFLSDPARKRATSSGLPTVAERPTLWNSPASSTSLSRPIASCAPLFEAASSWISSTTTCFTYPRLSRSNLPVNIACKVSGVVIKRSGGLRDCF